MFSHQRGQVLRAAKLENKKCSEIPTVRELIEALDLDGVVFSHLKFCDYSLFETPEIQAFLDRRELPFLIIENDYLWGDAERVKTRIEAFLEMVV